MTYWAVCQTQSRREQAVVVRLKRIGFETYLPKLKTKKEITAFFPGYLFVQIQRAFWDVRWTEGVIGLLMTADQRGLENLMTGIHKNERNGVIHARKTGFSHGQQLRVTNGSFAGQIGICAGLRGEDRSLVLLDLFGRLTQVELPNRDVTPTEEMRR